MLLLLEAAEHEEVPGQLGDRRSMHIEPRGDFQSARLDPES
jgi:hypothetical protein